MNTNPVGWFEIYVQDMERAKAFYEAVFQGKLERLPAPTLAPTSGPELEMWAFPMSQEGYGAAGALAKMEGGPSGGNTTLVYFKCEDCAVEAARAAEHGGRVVKEKMSIGKYGFIALVSDTEGNMIGLHSMR
jgi:predicted enzyme related to lactoylglutathione lyase